MRVYITNINGQAAQSTAQVAQNMVTDVALGLGFREMGIYCYDMNSDSPSELSKRIDGIVAGLRHGDVVIFQTPTWNTTAFDQRLMQKLRAYQIKIVLFIHDVVPLMFRESNYYLMEQTIAYYNLADVVIAPSQAMIDLLRQEGLTVEKTLVQRMWDHPTDVPMLPAQFEKKIHFPGSPERFRFVTQWAYDLPLILYSNQAADLPASVLPQPWSPDAQLLLTLSQGGFGLVWMDEHNRDYQQCYCPYKLGTFLAAGIPVIVQKGLANQDIIEKNQLGLVVEDLDQAVQRIHQLSQEDYQAMVERVRRFNPLLRQGYFTKKVLTDAVFYALQEVQ